MLHVHVRSQNLQRLTLPTILPPFFHFFHFVSHSSCSHLNVSLSHRGYRSLAPKSRYYGPAPSDVIPQVAKPSKIPNTDSGGAIKQQKEKNAKKTKFIRGTPEHLKFYSETQSARQMARNQQAFRKLVTTGDMRTLEPFNYENTIRYRLSFLAHKIYFPTIYYKPPVTRGKKPAVAKIAPVYNVFVLISFNPNPENPSTSHPFSCRTIPFPRKLKRLEESDPEYDPRMNQIGIKVYFEKPVFENHLEGMWVPVSDIILKKILYIYDTFGKGSLEKGEEIRNICAASFEKFVVRGEDVPVVW